MLYTSYKLYEELIKNIMIPDTNFKYRDDEDLL